MKLFYMLTAMLFATLSVPALADGSWDISQNPNVAPPIQQIESQLAMGANSNTDGNIQWDTRAINANNAQAYQAYLEQLAYQEQQANANKNSRIVSLPTGNQRNPNLPVCQTALMSPGGLQATTLDSFVMNAGGNAENIYGDEGTSDIPPLFGFTGGNTINSGIQGNLTTGHASGLPSAWTSY